jgi:hypothetical protein
MNETRFRPIWEVADDHYYPGPLESYVLFASRVVRMHGSCEVCKPRGACSSVRSWHLKQE